MQWDDELTEQALAAGAGADEVVSLVDELVVAARTALAYERGSSHIGISLRRLVDQGRGVCQYFAHLTIGLLRAVGVPARYVSGYLFASDERDASDETADTVVVQAYAWVEAAVPGQGWYAVDPTNMGTVGDRHVVIGHGRDYDDVAPVRGIYMGEGSPIHG